MKKILPLVFAMLVLLTACGRENTDDIEIPDWEPSEIYTDQEIEAAIQTVKDYFWKEFDGCILTKLYYPGDTFADEFNNWAHSMRRMRRSSFTRLSMWIFREGMVRLSQILPMRIIYGFLFAVPMGNGNMLLMVIEQGQPR